MVPEVRQLVRLLLVSPASSAQAERSFSALRRLKAWFCSSMTEVRLNSVAVCHIHQKLLDNTDMLPLLQQFAAKPDLRVSTFGQFV